MTDTNNNLRGDNVKSIPSILEGSGGEIPTSPLLFNHEPILDGKHPLLEMPNVICMPHLGWADHDTFEMYFGEAFEQVHLFANNLPLRLANPDVLNK